MVLGQILVITLALTGVKGSPQLLSEQQALERARQYCRMVEFGPFEPAGNLQHRLDVDEVMRSPIPNDPNAIVFQFRTALVGVNLQSGRIVGYADFRTVPWASVESVPLLSQAQLLEFTLRYHELAGQTDPLEVLAIGRQVSEQSDERDNPFKVHLLRKVLGLPYTDELGIFMTIEERSGRLKAYEIFEPSLPVPPSTIVPQTNAQNARAQMAASLFSRYPRLTELCVTMPARLAIWKPNLQGLSGGAFAFHDIAPAQMQLFQANRGVLTYWGRFCNNSDPQRATAGFQIYVDGMTGRVLASQDTFSTGRLGGDPRSGSKGREPFGWDVSQSSIEVSSGSKRTLVEKAQIDLAKTPFKAEKGKEVIVHFGKVYLRCQFFVKSGLLATERDGIRSFGKPNMALLKSLKGLVKKN